MKQAHIPSSVQRGLLAVQHSQNTCITVFERQHNIMLQ